jgi:predicted transcriptional regulator
VGVTSISPQSAARCIIEQEAVMTVRENVHQLVDALPEDRLADVLDYLADLQDADEVSMETEAAIKEGLADIRAGRTITIEEYRRTRGL